MCTYIGFRTIISCKEMVESISLFRTNMKGLCELASRSLSSDIVVQKHLIEDYKFANTIKNSDSW